MNTAKQAKQLVDEVVLKLKRTVQCNLVDDSWPVKYQFNTSLHHEDNMGRRLQLKTADELCAEVLRSRCCHLRLSLHQVEDEPEAFYLYYSPQ
jgi:hypothetical protein